MTREAILKAAMTAGCDEAERLGYGSELGYVEAASIAEKAAAVALGAREALDAGALHRAANEIATATPLMDQIAMAAAQFLRESEIHAFEPGKDELLEAIDFDPRALGYGIMLGYLAANE